VVTGLTRDIDVKIKISFFHNFDRIVFCIIIAMCFGIVVSSIKVFVKISVSYLLSNNLLAVLMTFFESDPYTCKHQRCVLQENLVLKIIVSRPNVCHLVVLAITPTYYKSVCEVICCTHIDDC